MKPTHTMTNEELAAIIRARGVVRGREMLSVPGMTHQIARIRDGKGGPGEGAAILALCDEAGLNDEANCSDERAQELNTILTAAYRDGLREGVGR